MILKSVHELGVLRNIACGCTTLWPSETILVLIESSSTAESNYNQHMVVEHVCQQKYSKLPELRETGRKQAISDLITDLCLDKYHNPIDILPASCELAKQEQVLLYLCKV